MGNRLTEKGRALETMLTCVPNATFQAPDGLIFMPQSIADALFAFPSQEEELSFVLLYRPQSSQYGKVMPIELMVVMGEGSRVEVSHNEEMLEVLNEFLARNHEYRYIDGHSHPLRLGHYYSENFSEGDLGAYRRAAFGIPGYMAVLVTANRIMFWPERNRLYLCSKEEMGRIFPEAGPTEARRKLNEISDINYYLFE